ncbi:MAG: HD domain-containing phosphohydrolase, partial [Aeromonas sp.]
MQNNMVRCALHYALSLPLFCLYSWHVSSQLECLCFFKFALPPLVMFIIMFIIRAVIVRQGWLARQDQAGNGLSWFGIDFGLYLLGGLLLAGYDALIYDFLLVTYLQILFGMITLGFLVAADLSLKHDWYRAKMRVATQHHVLSLPLSLSVPRKLTLFILSTLILLGGILFLLFSRDLVWLETVGSGEPMLDAEHHLLQDIALVMAVTFGYLALIIHGYGRNLTLSLHHQTHAMAKVQCGDLDARVPVTRNDEFGLIADSTNQMINAIQKRRHELHLTQDVAILGLASLAETRDNETGAHIVRTQHYVKALAEHLSQHHGDIYHLDEATIALLFKSAPLHDVGKVGIPDAILLKPGKLTDEEFAIMKRHPQIGSDALARGEAELGSTSFLRLAREIALTHHEKWDGSGYPAGLAGTEIPLSGRLMAVADVYDALIS